MRRLTHWQRKLIGLVATLVILSALLGDTEATHAAPDPSDLDRVTTGVLGCGTGSSRLLPGVDGTDSWTNRETAGPGEHGADRMQRSLAGVPPWVIWPPAPVPRVSGVMISSPAGRSRIADSTSLTADGTVPFAAMRPETDPAANPAGWPEPFCPLDRLPGVSQRFPRPPPA